MSTTTCCGSSSILQRAGRDKLPPPPYHARKPSKMPRAAQEQLMEADLLVDTPRKGSLRRTAAGVALALLGVAAVVAVLVSRRHSDNGAASPPPPQQNTVQSEQNFSQLAAFTKHVNAISTHSTGELLSPAKDMDGTWTGTSSCLEGCSSEWTVSCTIKMNGGMGTYSDSSGWYKPDRDHSLLTPTKYDGKVFQGTLRDLDGKQLGDVMMYVNDGRLSAMRYSTSSGRLFQWDFTSSVEVPTRSKLNVGTSTSILPPPPPPRNDLSLTWHPHSQISGYTLFKDTDIRKQNLTASSFVRSSSTSAISKDTAKSICFERNYHFCLGPDSSSDHTRHGSWGFGNYSVDTGVDSYISDTTCKKATEPYGGHLSFSLESPSCIQGDDEAKKKPFIECFKGWNNLAPEYRVLVKYALPPFLIAQACDRNEYCSGFVVTHDQQWGFLLQTGVDAPKFGGPDGIAISSWHQLYRIQQ